VHHYNSTQYCNTETDFSIFPFLQTGRSINGIAIHSQEQAEPLTKLEKPEKALRTKK